MANFDTSRLVTIQYLRGLAAGLVVLHHALNIPFLKPWYHEGFGDAGVHLFFVISGFIIWITTEEHNKRPAEFMAARIRRVVPLYWIFTTAFIAIALLAPGALNNEAIEWAHIIKSYLFVPEWHPLTHKTHPVYGLGWTLNYEMFFYFLFAATLFIRDASVRFYMIIATLLTLVLARHAVDLSNPAANVYTNTILLDFVAGVVIARLAASLCKHGGTIGWPLICAGVAWLAVNLLMPGIGKSATYGGAAALLVAGCVSIEPMVRKGSVSALGMALGAASYSIYLSHPFTERVWLMLFNASVGTQSMALAVIYVVTAMAISIAAGVACYHALEKPLLTALSPKRALVLAVQKQ